MTTTKLWNRNYLLLICVSFCSGMTAMLLNTALPLYLVDTLGNTATISGVMSAAYTVVASISRPLSGRFIDSGGRKKYIIIGFLIFAAGSFGFGLFSLIPLIFIFRLLQGVGFGTSSTATSAAVADSIPPEELGKGLGYFGLSNALTNIIGPAIALALYGLSAKAPFFAAGAACLLAALIAVTTKDTVLGAETSKKTDSGNSGIWRYIEKRALLPAIIQLFIALAISVFMVYIALFANRRGYESTSLFFALSAIGTVAARLTISKHVDKIGTMKLVIPANIICILACILIATTGSEIVFLASGVLYGISLGTSMPALNTMALRGIEPERRGAASGTYMFGFDGGIGLGAFIWGVVIDNLGYDAIFYGAALILVLVTLFCIFYSRRAVRPAAV